MTGKRDKVMGNRATGGKATGGRATGGKAIDRRTVLKGAAAGIGLAAGSGAFTGFPTIWAQNIKNVTLRQFGTGVSNPHAIAEKCKADTGINLQMTAPDSAAAAKRPVPPQKPFDNPPPDHT